MTQQAVCKFIVSGGCRTPAAIQAQLEYLSQVSHGGGVDIKGPQRHQQATLEYDDIARFALRWAEQTGKYVSGQTALEGDPDLTTHCVVSFPVGTEEKRAEDASRLWAEAMFEPQEARRAGRPWMDDEMSWYRDTYNYVTAFHTNVPHPHLHVVINRKAVDVEAGQDPPWLKIAKRHPYLNYDNMRRMFAAVAQGCGIDLEATSRAERGILTRALGDGDYWRQRADTLDGSLVLFEPLKEPDSDATPVRRASAADPPVQRGNGEIDAVGGSNQLDPDDSGLGMAFAYPHPRRFADEGGSPLGGREGAGEPEADGNAAPGPLDRRGRKRGSDDTAPIDTRDATAAKRARREGPASASGRAGEQQPEAKGPMVPSQRDIPPVPSRRKGRSISAVHGRREHKEHVRRVRDGGATGGSLPHKTVANVETRAMKRARLEAERQGKMELRSGSLVGDARQGGGGDSQEKRNRNSGRTR
jgi:hypothetical protein